VASLSQGRTAAAQCGLFTHKSVPVIFEPPCMMVSMKTCAHFVGLLLKITDYYVGNEQIKGFKTPKEV